MYEVFRLYSIVNGEATEIFKWRAGGGGKGGRKGGRGRERERGKERRRERGGEREKVRGSEGRRRDRDELGKLNYGHGRIQTQGDL